MAKGYNGFADVMRTTADGRDLAELFAELQAVTQIQNEEQQRFLDLFTYPTTAPVVSVLQTLGDGAAAFEEKSEYGVAVSKRAVHDALNMGAGFKWYDNRWAATWEYLQDATEAEIQASAGAIVNADTDLIFTKVMRTIFRNTNRSVTDKKTNAVYDVFAFANADGWVPPTYAANTFTGSHTHYRVSGGAAVVSGDLDEIVDDFKSHGYSAENGSQMVIFVNVAEANVINTSGWRAVRGRTSSRRRALGSSPRTVTSWATRCPPPTPDSRSRARTTRPSSSRRPVSPLGTSRRWSRVARSSRRTRSCFASTSGRRACRSSPALGPTTRSSTRTGSVASAPAPGTVSRAWSCRSRRPARTTSRRSTPNPPPAGEGSLLSPHRLNGLTGPGSTS